MTQDYHEKLIESNYWTLHKYIESVEERMEEMEKRLKERIEKVEARTKEVTDAEALQALREGRFTLGRE